MNNKGPRVLLLDIETAPTLGYVWGLFDQNIALNQIHTDWYIISWSAKWLNDPASKVMYMDQSKAKNIEDDSKILKKMWNLLNEADIVVTQNGKKFDMKKLNARFILNNMGPPSPYRQIDTLVIAKKNFGFTSNKLEYMTKKLCKKNKKSNHKKFSGFELWRECLAGNKAAWAEMKHYNVMDVLSLEELYHKLQPWDNSINFAVYNETSEVQCNCGSIKLQKRGYNHSNAGKYQRYQCMECGKWLSGKQNLFSKQKRASLIK